VWIRTLREEKGLPLPHLEQEVHRVWERALVKHLAYRNGDRLDELKERLGTACDWSTLLNEYADLGRLLMVLVRRGGTCSPRR
jgi:hypothetical protein